MPRTSLTSLERRFVLLVVKYGNLSRAYREAGYSENSKAGGTMLAQKPHIAAAIDRAWRKQKRLINIDAHSTLWELARVAFADPRGLNHPDGTPKLLSELDPDTAAACKIERIIESVAEDGTPRVVDKISFWPKTEALRDLARHFKLLEGMGVESETERMNRGQWAAVMERIGPEARARLREAHELLVATRKQIEHERTEPERLEAAEQEADPGPFAASEST